MKEDRSPTRIHEASASWSGSLESGEGRFESGSGAVAGVFNHESRLGRGFDTTPEELLGAAHATGFTMALAELLAAAGHVARSIRTRVEVRLTTSKSGAPSVEGIDLSTSVSAPGIDEANLARLAEDAKDVSVVARSLPATPIRLACRLED